MTGGDEELSKILGDDVLISKIIEAGEGEREAEGGAEAEQESDELYKLDYEDTVSVSRMYREHARVRGSATQCYSVHTMHLMRLIFKDSRTCHEISCLLALADRGRARAATHLLSLQVPQRYPGHHVAHEDPGQ